MLMCLHRHILEMSSNKQNNLCSIFKHFCSISNYFKDTILTCTGANSPVNPSWVDGVPWICNSEGLAVAQTGAHYPHWGCVAQGWGFGSSISARSWLLPLPQTDPPLGLPSHCPLPPSALPPSLFPEKFPCWLLPGNHPCSTWANAAAYTGQRPLHQYSAVDLREPITDLGLHCKCKSKINNLFCILASSLSSCQPFSRFSFFHWWLAFYKFSGDKIHIQRCFKYLSNHYLLIF